jgi:hypothetical protein
MARAGKIKPCSGKPGPLNKNYKVDWDEVKVPTGFIGRMRVSVQSVINSCGGTNSCMESWIAQQATKVADYQLAALLLWCHALDSAGLHWIGCTAASVSMTEWEEKGITEVTQIARRCGRLGGAQIGTHTLAGRMKTLLGRDLRNADAEDELAGRTTVINSHMCAGPTVKGGAAWRKAFDKHAKRFLKITMSQVEHEQDMETWWKRRSMWLPTGTSSIKNTEWIAKAGLESQWHDAIRGQRRSKALQLAGKEFSWIKTVFNREPAMQCRFATKNEPGLKRRPLRALDDAAFAIQAFASAYTEKTWSVLGAVPRQQPEDVATTCNAIKHLEKDTHMLCADYSAFNENHRVTDRVRLNHIYANMLKQAGRKNRAEAAAWVGLAHLNHWLGDERCNSGLSSGERDTARDNTMLHWIYQQIALEEAGAWVGSEIKPKLARCCGDDEILVGMKRSESIAYVLTLERHGFRLQKQKTMLSNQVSEFLQYNFGPNDTIPRQPLPPNLINYVSGSWYKSGNYEAGTVPQQAAEAAASLYRRGLPLTSSRKLCIATCNWLCKSLPWRTALMSMPLFGSTSMMPEEMDDARKIVRENVKEACSKMHGKVPGWKDYTEEAQRVINWKHIREDEPNGIARRLRDEVEQRAMAGIVSDVLRTKKIRHAEVKETQDAERVIAPEWDESVLTLYNKTKKETCVWMRTAAGKRMSEWADIGAATGLPEGVVKKLLTSNSSCIFTQKVRNKICRPEESRRRKISPRIYMALPGAVAAVFECI